jgi:hypothetical protein
MSPCLQGAAHGFVSFCQWLVSRCSLDLNTPTSDGSTALHLAASKGHLAVVQWLVSAGADPELLDRSRRTAEAVASSVCEREVRYPVTLTRVFCNPCPATVSCRCAPIDRRRRLRSFSTTTPSECWRRGKSPRR